MALRTRVMDVEGDGALRAAEGIELVGRPPTGTLRWIDVRGQEKADIDLLGERFGFHPLALEDCLHFDQRPKLEEYGDYLFLVLHAFQCSADDPCHVDP